MLDHNEKLKLVIEYINAGVKSVEEITHNIGEIEAKLFTPNPSNNLTKKGRKLQRKGLLNSKNLNKE